MKRISNLLGVCACVAGLGLLGACSTTSGGANPGDLGNDVKAGSCSSGGGCSEGGKSCSEGAKECTDKKDAGNMSVVSPKATGGACCETGSSCCSTGSSCCESASHKN